MPEESWTDAWIVRSLVYAFLGNSFLKPMSTDTSSSLEAGFWENFPIEHSNEHMYSALNHLTAIAKTVTECNRNHVIKDIAIEYTQLFVGPGTPVAPPWESLYRENAKLLFGQPTFDMREIFRNHHLKLNGEVHQLEDHLGVELLFLSAMSERFAADLPSIDAVQEQAAFLDNHPLWWIDRFYEKARANESMGYYSSIIELAWGIMLWDKDLLGEFDGS